MTGKVDYIPAVTRALDLYREYRQAVTAHPYDPIAAGETFTALSNALLALTAAARNQAEADILRVEFDEAAVERAARALPIGKQDTLRLLTHARVLLEEGATVDELTTAMSRGRTAADGPPLLSGTQYGVPFEVRTVGGGVSVTHVRVTHTLPDLAAARSWLGLRDEVE